MYGFLEFVQKHCTVSIGKISDKSTFSLKIVRFIAFYGLWMICREDFLAAVVNWNIIMESMHVYEAATWGIPEHRFLMKHKKINCSGEMKMPWICTFMKYNIISRDSFVAIWWLTVLFGVCASRLRRVTPIVVCTSLKLPHFSARPLQKDLCKVGNNVVWTIGCCADVVTSVALWKEIKLILRSLRYLITMLCWHCDVSGMMKRRGAEGVMSVAR